MRVLVTGARGFVGKNLCEVLRRMPGLVLTEFDKEDDDEVLVRGLREALVTFHLAGVNRPESPEELTTGNVELTARICRSLVANDRPVKLVLSSSIQAERDNPYGRSKLAAEAAVRELCARSEVDAVVHRLTNLFGKWCRPNYNSVTATFCHNIARGLPIRISDPSTMLSLTYVDDVVTAFIRELEGPPRPGFRFAPALPVTQITLGDLARTIQSFRDHRSDLVLGDYSSPFIRALYATYLSHLDPEQLAYPLTVRADERGSLAEFLKSPHSGQLFVSRTRPGVTRGNHFHHTKAEKFLVVQGEALVRLRQIHSDAIVEIRVRGEDCRVIDIPPGYSHSIQNVGSQDMVTLFWATEIFDRERPDTVPSRVLAGESKGGDR